MKLRAFHGDQAIKDKYLDRVRMHRAADNLIHGTGWENGKGCAIGCTLEAYDHSQYPVELGIPEVLARIEDRLFEGMTNGDSQAWPEQFLEAITPGADLSMVWYRFQRRLLVDAGRGTLRLCKGSAHDASLNIIAMFDRYIAGDAPSDNEWLEGRAAAAYAYAPADDAAYAAAAAAAYAADAAAYAYAAAYADAAAYAAYAAAWLWIRDTLLRVLSESPVVTIGGAA